MPVANINAGWVFIMLNVPKLFILLLKRC